MEGGDLRMSTVDDRIVSMKFDNAQFKTGAAETLSALDKLKAAFKLDGAKKNLDDLQNTGNRFNLSTMGRGIEEVAHRFDALKVAGIAALATLASQAVMYGQRLAQALISPIKQGMEEYETNLNAIQTILSNTQSAGTNLKDVNGALQELNTYSDQTIYNFSEMAKNIGTFTAAGVNLKDSTAAIKGIANLAALSGSNSQQASTAMYQLSQAISAGKVGLQDWNSVVNAGMGGTVFQRALAQNAVKMGTLSDGAVKLKGDMKNVSIEGKSFRDSISAEPGKESWLTSDVLTRTLSQFTGDLGKAELAAQGFNDAEIEAIQKQAATAKSAATVVKTFTQLMGTLAESQGSGWSQSFQLIFGDFEQAKTLWTAVNNELGGMISNSAKARNKILADWQKAGGRDAAIDTVKNLWAALLSIITPIKAAFRDIFPAMQGKNLAEMTKNLRDFTAGLKLSGPAGKDLQRTFKGFFALLDIGWTILKSVIDGIFSFFGAVETGNGGFLEFTGNLGDGIVAFRDWLKSGNILTNFFKSVGSVIAVPINLIKAFIGVIGQLFKGIDFKDLNFDGFGETLGRIGDRLKSFGVIGQWAQKVWEKVGDFFGGIGDKIGPSLDKVGEALGDIGGKIAEGFSSGNFEPVFDAINTGLLAGIFLTIRGFFKNFSLKSLFGGGGDDGPGFVESIKNVFGGMTDSLKAMTASLKAKTLMNIAIAIGLLAASAVALSMVDSKRLTSALGGMAVLFAEMVASLIVLEKYALGAGFVKIPVIAAGMIILGAALLILTASVKSLAKLSWDELLRGLTGLGVVLGLMVGTAQGLRGAGPGMVVAGAGMTVMAAGIKVLASATADFASLSWEEIGRGLTGVGSVLAAVLIFTKLAKADKGAAISAVNIILLGSALKLLASATKDFSELDAGALTQGLIGVGVVLGLLVGFTKATSGAAGMITTGVGLIAVAAAMKILASAVKDFAQFSWDEIGRGLVSMAGAMVIVGAALVAIPPSSIVGAGALVIAAFALGQIAKPMMQFSKLNWGAIGQAVGTLGITLGILAAALLIMEGTLPGAAALVVAAYALSLLAPPIILLSQLEWGAIGQAMGALGIGLAILAVGGVALLPAIPGLLALGFAIGLIGLGVGVAAFGLGNLALGLVALGAAGPLAATGITAIATAILNLIPLAIQKLGEGIIAFANVIATSGPALLAAFVALITSLLTAVDTVAPRIIDTLVGLVMKLIDVLNRNLPTFLQKGMEMIIKILEGIAANAGKLTDAGTDAVVKFITAIGNNSGRVSEAGVQTLIKFVNGISGAIESHTGEMRAAGLRLAAAIVDGMSGGLLSGAVKVAAKAFDLGRQAIAAAKNALDSHSPSKEFIKIGEDTAEGGAIGIENNTGMVENASRKMGESAIDTMRETVKSIASVVTDNMDTNPTIRPVLDLTGIKKDSSLISGMMGVSAMKVDPSYAYASSIARDYNSGQQTKDEAVAGSKAGTVIKIEQTNTSPKALSEADIWRNTKNAISLAEEAFNNA
jgi:tape measure domain-containing protein